MNALSPRTLTGQLVLLAIGVLLTAQAISLLLYAGERNLVLTSTQIEAIADRYVARAAKLPPFEDQDLPMVISEGGPKGGVIFLSRHNRAERPDPGKRLPKYEVSLSERLQEIGLKAESLFVVRRKAMPHPGPGMRPPGRRPPPRHGPPPPHARPGEPGGRSSPPPHPPDRFHPRLPPMPGGPPPTGVEEIAISAEIQPGMWLNAMVPFVAAEAITQRFLWATLALAAVAALAVWLFATRVTRPLANLAAAADKLGRGERQEPLDVTGPSDLRTAARAFNQMQNRLTRLIDNQRMMLRAVGHDLRTPLTSLRLRAEAIPPEHDRDKIIATLEDMKTQTEEILRWAKDASGLEDVVPVDLTAMVSSIVDDYADMGRDVNYDLDAHETQIVRCRRVSIKRAISNLIDNALKYGSRAAVVLEWDDREVRIHIDDDGPGIPEDRIDDVTKPFVRLEASRGSETGGIGLGLSITQSIAENHGGKIHFANRPGGGLRASLILPVAKF